MHPYSHPKKRKQWPLVALGIVIVLVTAALIAVLLLTLHSSLAPDAAPAPQPPRQNLLTETPATGDPVTYQGIPQYNACAVLTQDVVTSAGLTYSNAVFTGGSQFVPGPDRPAPHNPDNGSCGGDLTAVSGAQVNLAETVQRLADRSLWNDWVAASGGTVQHSHDVPYVRVKSTPALDEIHIRFGDGGHHTQTLFDLSLTSAPKFPDAEGILATLIDGVAKNIAAGPKPMPDHHYPTPYNLVAKPCEAFSPALFTTITGKPTDGFRNDLFGQSETPGPHGNAVTIRCDLSGAGADPVVTLNQTIHATTDQAAESTRDLCAYNATHSNSSPLPHPVGDISCGSNGQIDFHAGRAEVSLIVYTNSNVPLDPLNTVAQQIYRHLHP